MRGTDQHSSCGWLVSATHNTRDRSGINSFGKPALMHLSCAGQKKAREVWFLARLYSAQQALDMGLINAVVPLDKLEEESPHWCARPCVAV